LSATEYIITLVNEYDQGTMTTSGFRCFTHRIQWNTHNSRRRRG